MIVLGLCCLGLLASDLASAKDKNKGGNKPTEEQRTAAKALLAKYDANTNGILDPDEIVALQKDYAAGKADDAKLFDVNNDKVLDENEITTLRATTLTAKVKRKKK